MLNPAIYYLEQEIAQTPFLELLPQLEIVAKLNKLKLNRAADFKIAKRLLIMNIYLN